MNLNVKQMNTLPEPTWVHLGFNGVSLETEIPEIRPYPGKAVTHDLPAGVEVTGGAVSAPEVKTGMGPEAVSFAETNRSCGVSVRVPAGVKAKTPVFLSYTLDKVCPAVVDVNTVVAEENSEITVVMSYSSAPDFEGFHSGLTRLYAGKNAVIRLVQVQLLGDRCLGWDDIGARMEENGEVDVVQAELGGAKVFAGCRARLEGRRSRLNIETIYFGDRSRETDINYLAEHAGEKTQSEIHVNGALLDQSRKTFRGTIDFLKGAKQAVGHESETNLLFSPSVRNRTAPLILCAEDDVEGQHAASTGRMDEEKLFYLMSRGLSELEAKKLMIEAQFQPAVRKIPEPSLRNAIADYVKVRLDRIEPVS